MVVSTAPKITDTLNSFTSKLHGIPGIVFRAVKKDGTVLFEGASGVKGLNHKDQPVTTDTLFWVASCTKLWTAVAILQLVEQGKLALDDHAEKYLPEIGKIQILTGFDAGDKPIFQEPKTKITIQHLLTNTSGFVYDVFNPLMKKYAQINNIPHKFSTKRRNLDFPLAFEPGTCWEYGMGMDWLGLVIEKVTGQTLDAYMKEHISTPLGIHATFLTDTAQDHAHLHLRTPDNNLSEIDPMIAQGDKIEMHAGGVGLHSSVVGHTTVLLALLNEGEVNGKHILKKESVDLLFAEQSTPIEKAMQNPKETTSPEISNNVAVPPGIPVVWTFGGMKFNCDLPTGRSSGSVWWSGVTNCFWWVDRTKGVAGAFFTQILPFSDGEVTQCFATCEQLLYAGL